MSKGEEQTKNNNKQNNTKNKQENGKNILKRENCIFGGQSEILCRYKLIPPYQVDNMTIECQSDLFLVIFEVRFVILIGAFSSHIIKNIIYLKKKLSKLLILDHKNT